MARLIAPNGATVSVSDERAKVLVHQGYKTAEKPAKKATAKKASSSKSKK